MPQLMMTVSTVSGGTQYVTHVFTLGRTQKCPIGRGVHPGIHIASKRASRQHACVYFDGTQAKIKDGSKHGTRILRINGSETIVGREGELLTDGDVIMIAGRRICYMEEGADLGEVDGLVHRTTTIASAARPLKSIPTE
jgi:pSer/pThr/pTyr-binding forkhead associated (FHA) protein